MFGNSIEDEKKNIEALLLPKLMSLNSVNFDFIESSFNDENNNLDDGKGNSRDGSGRAVIYKETQLPFCFTLECNYATGVRLNTLKPRYDVESKMKILKEESVISDSSSSFYKK